MRIIYLISISFFLFCKSPSGNEIEIFTKEFTLSFEEATIENGVAKNTIQIPELTEETIESGVIDVKVKIEGEWFPLPYTFSYDIDQDLVVDLTVELTYSISEGELSIIHSSSYESTFFISTFSEGPYRLTALN